MTPYGSNYRRSSVQKRKRYFAVIFFPTTAILTSNGACCWRWWSTWPFLGGESSRSAYSPSRICPISWPKPNGSWCFLKPFSGRDKRMEISSDVAGCCEHNLKIFMFQKNYFMMIIKGPWRDDHQVKDDWINLHLIFKFPFKLLRFLIEFHQFPQPKFNNQFFQLTCFFWATILMLGDSLSYLSL